MNLPAMLALLAARLLLALVFLVARVGKLLDQTGSRRALTWADASAFTARIIACSR
jgi:uncharacterized membrane protein YphA (DoxX/SURF4 family)